MLNMREVKQWGLEAKGLVRSRKEAEQARQKVTYGKHTIYVRKGELINMVDFVK